MVVYIILFDLGVIFLSSKTLRFRVFYGLLSGHFFIGFCIEISTLGTSISRFSHEGIAKIGFPWKSFLMNFEVDSVRCLDALGTGFVVFWALKTDLKIDDFLVM